MELFTKRSETPSHDDSVLGADATPSVKLERRPEHPKKSVKGEHISLKHERDALAEGLDIEVRKAGM